MSSLPEHQYKALKKLYAILIELGYDFRRFGQSKDSRIVFQKLVYALQKSGIQFGYNYNLYINGPYSPGLASDGYAIMENLNLLQNDESPFCLSDSGRSKVQAAREFLNGDVSTPNWLETITTLDFILRSSPSLNKEAAFDAFLLIKPHLKDKGMLNLAWSKIGRS